VRRRKQFLAISKATEHEKKIKVRKEKKVKMRPSVFTPSLASTRSTYCS
jgi:hypothetical protein